MAFLQKFSICKFSLKNTQLISAWRRKKIVFAVASYIFIVTQVYADNQYEYPLDVRNNFAPTYLHLDPQAVSPTTLSKGKSYLNTNLSLASDIKSSNLYAEKDIPFDYQRPVLWDFFRKRYPSQETAYLVTDYFRFGRLENQYRTEVDLESSLFQLRYNYGLTNSLEVGIQVSAISLNTGVLDGFINSYHSLIGVKTGKELVDNNVYKYKITDEAMYPVIGTPPRTGVGDSILSGKWNIKSSPENGFSSALVAMVKIPTGSFKYEMSNGKVDGAFGISSKYKYKKFRTYLNLYGVGVSNSLENSNISLRNFVSSTLTFEYQIFEKMSALVQIDAKSSAFRSHTPFLSRPPVMLSMGLNIKVRSTSMLQLIFMEDLTITVPDVTMQVGWREYL